jgi:hypothetical protein
VAERGTIKRALRGVVIEQRCIGEQSRPGFSRARPPHLLVGKQGAGGIMKGSWVRVPASAWRSFLETSRLLRARASPRVRHLSDALIRLCLCRLVEQP